METPGRPLRVVLVSHYALPHMGGIETLVHELASELARRGHGVTHVAGSPTRPHEPDPGSVETTYRLVRVPAANPLEARFGVPYPLFRPGLTRAIGREAARADVLHAHGFLYAGTRAGIRAARRAGVPVVLTEHTRSAPVMDQLRRRPGHVPYDNRLAEVGDGIAAATLGRRSLRRADAVVVFNERVRAMVQRLAPGARVEWIESGVNTEAFHPPLEGERERIRERLGWDARPRVLFVGRATAKKGFDLALQALEAGRGDFVLAVAGHRDVADRADLDALGPVSRERLAEIYRGADALLIPSSSEGLPVALLEGLASGLPAVVAGQPGFGRVLTGAGTALTLAEPQPTRLAEALTAVLGEADGAPNMEAVRFVRDRLSLERWADSHERLYRSLLERAR